MKNFSNTFGLVTFFLAGCFLATTCLALEPEEILVIANGNAAKSLELAAYYQEKRRIPRENLVMVLITDTEECSRSDYNKKIAVPVRRYLEKIVSDKRIRCLVIMYGLPLKIAAPEMSQDQKKYLQSLQEKQQILINRLNQVTTEHPEEQKHIQESLDNVKKKISELIQSLKSASSSLESEIALILVDDYTLSGWIPNPYFLGNKDQKLSIAKENVLMVSRLDGPTDKDVRRIIKDTIEAEEKGLKGTAYFDARWPDPGNKKLYSYAYYDHSLYRAADRVKQSDLMPIKLEKTEKLFQPGECPDAALYCGWYSLAHYVDAFVWQPGSIGYHIASSECSTLKKEGSQVWCKMMIAKGIAATIGPVEEPYVQAFPVPEIFFGLLVDGYLSLAECYMVSTPFLSWRMVLIGDPLYRPFKNSVVQKPPMNTN